MVHVVLGGIAGIAKFQVGELGDLAEAAFLIHIGQEDIVAVVAGMRRVAAPHGSRGPVAAEDDAVLVGEGHKGGIHIIPHIVGDLLHLAGFHVVDIDVGMAVFHGAEDKPLVVQEILGILHLVKGQLLADDHIGLHQVVHHQLHLVFFPVDHAQAAALAIPGHHRVERVALMHHHAHAILDEHFAVHIVLIQAHVVEALLVFGHRIGIGPRVGVGGKVVVVAVLAHRFAQGNAALGVVAATADLLVILVCLFRHELAQQVL